MRKLFLITICLFLVTVAGCGKAGLHHGLSEGDADEIMFFLQDRGIDAEKKKEVTGNEVSWTVMVSDLDLNAARKILIDHNLPRKQELGLSGVYKDKGIIPTPDEQKARFLLSLKGEIINSLEKIPEVIDADVVLNVPKEGEFSVFEEKKQRPTASVVIKLKPVKEYDVMITEAKIQRFVANAIPDMDPNDVVVVITTIRSESAPTPVPAENIEDIGGGDDSTAYTGDYDEVAGLKVDSGSTNRFKAYVIVFLIILIILSIALIYNVVRLNRMKQDAGRKSVTAVPTGDDRPPMIEGGV